MNVRGCVVFNLNEKEMNDLRQKISESEEKLLIYLRQITVLKTMK
jgi:hypothetical protein